MAASHPRKKRIEIDVLFAPLPQALVLDRNVSAQACRLWGVLYVFRWNDIPPDFDKLAEALNTTDRSVYRWLQELEATGWIAWNRNASVPDRFTLCTTAAPAQSDTGVNSAPHELIPRSKQLIPRSKQLTQVSEELTQVSIPALFDPAPMPQTESPPSDQKDQKIQNGVGVGERTLAFLIDQGVNAAEEFAHLPYDAMRADYDARRADGQNNGSIVRAWRRNPPTETYHYERQSRPVQPDVPPDRPRRSAAKGSHAPTGGADLRDPGWKERLIELAERGELP